MSDNNSKRDSFKISAAPVVTNNLTQGQAHAAIHHNVGNSVKLDSTIPKTSYRIFQAWAHKPVYQAADAWITQHFDHSQAHWDFDAGSSWIDSVRYPGAVYFKKAEDYTAFKLRFGDICV